MDFSSLSGKLVSTRNTKMLSETGPSLKVYSTVVMFCCNSIGIWPWFRYWTKPLGSWFLF